MIKTYVKLDVSMVFGKMTGGGDLLSHTNDRERGTSMQDTNDEIEIYIPGLLHSIWDLRWIILFLMVLGALAGTALSLDGGTTYETRASMIVNARNTNDVYQNGTPVPKNEDIQLARNLVKTVQLLATSNRVLELIEAVDIRPKDPDKAVGLLSGGNQQKVVLGKWLMRGLKLLIVDEPTAGIDVGAKDEIYRILRELALRGVMVILVSSDLCDRQDCPWHCGRHADHHHHGVQVQENHCPGHEHQYV